MDALAESDEGCVAFSVRVPKCPGWLTFSEELTTKVPKAHEVNDTISVVVLQSQMRNQLFAFQMAQGVFQLHQLNE